MKYIFYKIINLRREKDRKRERESKKRERVREDFLAYLIVLFVGKYQTEERFVKSNSEN